MAKRKRLTPLTEAPTAPEVKSAFLRPAPIAQVASEAATSNALQELTTLVSTARAEGRLIQHVPLDQIDAGHMVRDRLLDAADEDMVALIESLRARGQQTPIDVVALEDGRFGLISGLRRLTALTQLGSKTVLARLIAPESASGAYVAMVEENEIRAGLSLYERARIVAKAVEAGVFPDVRDALLTLYASTPRAKRSKIKAVLPVVEALDGALRFPTALSERACLDLARALEGDPSLPEFLRARLTEAAPDTPAAEAALLTALKPIKTVEIEYSEADSGNPAAFAPQEVPKTQKKADVSHTMQTDTALEKKVEGDTPHKPLDAFEPVPGVYVQSQSTPKGHTRLILTGPNVSDAMREKISRWLRAEKRGELS